MQNTRIHIDRIFPNHNLHVAVSGGVDSISAAHFLLHMNYDFKILHFNHQQRPQNKEMQNSVENFCESFDLDLVVGSLDEFPSGDSTSEEKALREARHAFFGSVPSKPQIIMAHHLDDAVESYLMNCITGKPEHKPIPEFCDWENFTIYRPFLKNRKLSFINWCKNHNLEKFVVDDESNNDVSYRRNYIRKVVVPSINNIYSGLPKIVKKKFYLNEKNSNQELQKEEAQT